MVQEISEQPVVRPFEGMLIASSEHHFSPNDNPEDSAEEDFTGATDKFIEEEKVQAEECKDSEQRMNDNVKAFEKKLSDFERMFLFINDELDFRQLSEMAQEVERFKESNGGGDAVLDQQKVS